GRPVGARPGDPRRDGRLDVAATLRAAAPWARFRRNDDAAADDPRTPVRPSDFHVRARERPRASTVLFVVDASGSAAAARLAETKGAVERLLADCYARRDEVALIAFRGDGARLELPPTRALARARRALGDLMGGGGTPLAAGLVAAESAAERERARGRTPFVVVLSDGGANVAANGVVDRARAFDDAEKSAARLRAAGVGALFFDVSPRPNDKARLIARAMGARYEPLPHVDGGRVAALVNETRRGGRLDGGRG
ncbi:MAG: VWA domain-containing protein, partial [Parvularculaceae bacterium]